MIQAFVDRFMAGRDALKAKYEASSPDSYDEIVKDVIEIVSGHEHCVPDKDRITKIDHGDYHGTEVYVIGCTGSQPSTYWYVMVSYGSCSGCDTLQEISDVDGYLTLALHLVQGLKRMGYDCE